MNIYKKGKVVSLNKEYIIFENKQDGYLIYTPKPDVFEIDKFTKLFVYNLDNEYNKKLFGFKHFKERLVFSDLLEIAGVGPRTAISLLRSGYEETAYLIAKGDWESLSKLPYINTRVARQIVFEYQKKYAKIFKFDDEKISATSNVDELNKTLKMLGFNKQQINFAVENVKKQANIELMVEQAIKLIANEKQNQQQG